MGHTTVRLSPEYQILDIFHLCIAAIKVKRVRDVHQISVSEMTFDYAQVIEGPLCQPHSCRTARELADQLVTTASPMHETISQEGDRNELCKSA